MPLRADRFFWSLVKFVGGYEESHVPMRRRCKPCTIHQFKNDILHHARSKSDNKHMCHRNSLKQRTETFCRFYRVLSQRKK